MNTPADQIVEAGTGVVSAAKLLEGCERLTAGMAYSYFRKLDFIRQMLFQAPTS